MCLLSCYLLKFSNLNIAIIAINVGYISSSKFSEFFKKAKKMTSTKYRSMYKDNIRKTSGFLFLIKFHPFLTTNLMCLLL